jgi:hypothetical protein
MYFSCHTHEGNGAAATPRRRNEVAANPLPGRPEEKGANTHAVYVVAAML